MGTPTLLIYGTKAQEKEEEEERRSLLLTTCSLFYYEQSLADFVLSKSDSKSGNITFIICYSIIKLLDAYLWSITIPLSFLISNPARRKAIANLFRIRWEINVSREFYYEMIILFRRKKQVSPQSLVQVSTVGRSTMTQVSS